MTFISEKLMGEFASKLMDLDKTTSPTRIVAISDEIAEIREKIMANVLPVGLSSFQITYDASREGLPEFYLERPLIAGETVKLNFFLLAELEKIFRHYFRFSKIIISRESIMLVFEIA